MNEKANATTFEIAANIQAAIEPLGYSIEGFEYCPYGSLKLTISVPELSLFGINSARNTKKD